MQSLTKSLLLGELLVGATMLTEAQRFQAISLATELDLRIGQAIILLSFIDEKNLRLALEVQCLVNDGLLDSAVAFAVLSRASHSSQPLTELLAELGFTLKEPTPTNKLGELLIEAEAITDSQLLDALALANATALPLGRVLVLTGRITEELLAAALNAQLLIRSGRLSRQQATKAIKSTNNRVLARPSFHLPIARAQTVRLGQLLRSVGWIADKDLNNALEVGLSNDEPLGKVLIELNLISEDQLNKALKVQHLVSIGTVTKLEAPRLLNDIASLDVDSFEEALLVLTTDSHRRDEIGLEKLLILSGCLKASDVKDLTKEGGKRSSVILAELLAEQRLSTEMINSALRCESLIRRGLLSLEQAIVTLNRCNALSITCDIAIEQLGWFYSNQPKP